MVNRAFIAVTFTLLMSIAAYGQDGTDIQKENIERIKTSVPQSEVEMHIHFLAADEFMGRDTGTPHLDIAARYIATWFRTNGIDPLPGQDDHFQTIPFERIEKPVEGEITVGDSSFVIAQDFIPLNTLRGDFNGSLLVLEHGTRDELENQDPEGKIVVVKPGTPGQLSPQQWLMGIEQKNMELQERGAVAVIELYDSNQLPWQMIVDYLSIDRLEIAADVGEGSDEIPHFWLDSSVENLHSAFSEMVPEDVSISVPGTASEKLVSHNVVGFVEGTDPDLKQEYLLLGAHYDHVGVVEGEDIPSKKSPVNLDGDYIYNGARDNAVGVSGIMMAARYLAENPPKRSVIFATWTAEEIGLLGSRYFSENPMVPLDQIIFNLNIDGAGYNDTTKVMVIGLERTEAENDLRAAADAFGLEAIQDPVPEQNLFDRSDNVNFAINGIPAPTYSLGLTAFDEEIEEFYHTVKDEPHSVNYPYITRYIRSFLLAAQKVANAEHAPFWREDDFYEDAGRELYGR